jgi:hypothetical protein
MYMYVLFELGPAAVCLQRLVLCIVHPVHFDTSPTDTSLLLSLLPHFNLQYASFAGIVGLVVYAIASGLPILLIALFGSYMKQVR